VTGPAGTGRLAVGAAVLAAVVLGAALAACGAGAPASSTEGTADPAEAGRALLVDDGWTLRQAVEPAVGEPGLAIEQPPLSWWSEYERVEGASGLSIRLSGHRGGLEETVALMERLGFVLDEVEVEGWTGVAGTSAVDPGGPAMMVLAHGSTSVVVLSYELDVSALAALGSSIEIVDGATWDRAVGDGR
jgi:hypothetical protein